MGQAPQEQRMETMRRQSMHPGKLLACMRPVLFRHAFEFARYLQTVAESTFTARSNVMIARCRQSLVLKVHSICRANIGQRHINGFLERRPCSRRKRKGNFGIVTSWCSVNGLARSCRLLLFRKSRVSSFANSS